MVQGEVLQFIELGFQNRSSPREANPTISYFACWQRL